MNGIKIGIDLGTTFSSMAYLDDNGIPSIIPNQENKELTPSVVLIDDKEIQVGEIAANQLFIRRENVVQSIKRSMGDENYSFKGLSSTQISAEILKKLKRDAEIFFNTEISEAVVTVPAYFGDHQRKATKEAGQLANLSVLDLPNEPTAAALYYGYQNVQEGEKILVFDLGGGTFDATILHYEESNFQVLSTAGSRELGGKNWTEMLIEWVTDKYEEFFNTFPASELQVVEMVNNECEKAKKALSKLQSVNIPLFYQGRTEIVPLSLEDFNEMTEPLLYQTIEKVREAMVKAALDWKDINKIILVGGSSRLKQVEMKLVEESGIRPTKFGNVDTIVALGSALYTDQIIYENGKRGIRIRDKGGGVILRTLQESTTFGLGTIVEVRDGLSTSVIIKPQTNIPASVSKRGYYTSPSQTEIDIPVLHADEDGLDPTCCDIRSSYRFSGVPIRSASSEIEVKFSYDKDAIIDVEAIDLETGKILEKNIVPFVYPARPGSTSRSTQSIVLIIDTSGSMEGYPLEEAKNQLNKVCDQLLSSSSKVNIGLVEFGKKTQVVSGLTKDIKQIKSATSGLVAGRGTPMGKGMNLAYGILEKVEDSRIAILISDGFPNNRVNAIKAADKIKNDKIKLFTISIGTSGAEFLADIGDEYEQIETSSGISKAISNLLKL